MGSATSAAPVMTMKYIGGPVSVRGPASVTNSAPPLACGSDQIGRNAIAVRMVPGGGTDTPSAG